MPSDRVEKENTAATRRRFVTLALGASAAIFIKPSSVFAALPVARQLSFRHLHTGERVKSVYWEKGRYIPESLREINRLMRDFRTDQVKPMDPRILDILYALSRRVECTNGFTIIGGYRSPTTNSMLREASAGVAKNSLHLKGQAVDLTLPGCSLANLRRAALSLQAGGVGYYPSSDFLHVDCGPVRSW